MTAIIVFGICFAMLLFAIVMSFVTGEAMYPTGALILGLGIAASITKLYTEKKKEGAAQRSEAEEMGGESSTQKDGRMGFWIAIATVLVLIVFGVCLGEFVGQGFNGLMCIYLAIFVGSAYFLHFSKSSKRDAKDRAAKKTARDGDLQKLQEQIEDQNKRLAKLSQEVSNLRGNGV